MTYKEKLIEFVEIKDSYLSIDTLHYICKEDIYELETWSEDLCQRIYEYIRKYIYEADSFRMDTRTCPWCIIDSLFGRDDSCSNCNYGKRHGVCIESGSLYNKLAIEGELPITMLEYKKIIDDIEKKSKQDNISARGEIIY